MTIGRHQSAVNITDTWLTPPDILRRLGAFDLDPCAAPAPRPWPTARTHYDFSHGQDGLALPWAGRVFVNPPYGGPKIIGPWLRKMAEHGRGTLLIFARTETAAFHRYVWERAAACLFIEGRLHFHYPDGQRAEANGGAPSVLAAYGEDDAAILENSGIAGAFVGLR